MRHWMVRLSFKIDATSLAALEFSFKPKLPARKSMLLTAALIFFFYSSEAAKFTVVNVDDGFDVTVEGITVFRHTRMKPMLLAGEGETRFHEFLGNFKIEDYTANKQGLANFTIKKEDDQTSIVFNNANYQITLKLWSADNAPLELALSVQRGSPGRLWLRLYAEKDELVYGGGEQPSYLDLRGRVYPVWTREQGVGRNKSEMVTFLADTEHGGAGGDYYTTYHSQPSFVTSRRVLFHMEEAFYSLLDFTQPDFHEIMILGVPSQLFVDAASSWPDIMPKVAMLLGSQPPLPDWLHEGVILGVQGGTQTMLERLESAQQVGTKVSGLWIQDWTGILMTSFGQRLNWNWVWNEQRYPGLKDEIVKLKASGVRVLGYINMHLTTTGSLYKEADQKGYLVKTSSGASYQQDFGEFSCGTVDLTNPEARTWYKGVIKTNMIDLGLSGWMADFGEYLPTSGVQVASGISAQDAHNAYPTLWAQLNREAIAEAHKLGDVFFFTRSGYSGVGRYTTLQWHGDQNVDFTLADGVASTVTSALSLAFSGVWLSHFDVGGYTTFPPMVRTPELLLRSAEYAAFTPAFRSHEGNMPKMNAQFYSSPDTLAGFAWVSKVFAALKDYRKAVIGEASQGKMPTQRPLFLHYPEDQQAYRVQYQYLFGADLLVAPVHSANVSSWSVYLPADSWVHIWTGSEYGGGTVKVASPLGKPPVFYRKQSTYSTLFRSLRNINGDNFKTEL